MSDHMMRREFMTLLGGTASRVVARIRAAGESLAETPSIGRAGIVSETREWVVRGLPYIMVY